MNAPRIEKLRTAPVFVYLIPYLSLPVRARNSRDVGNGMSLAASHVGILFRMAAPGYEIRSRRTLVMRYIKLPRRLLTMPCESVRQRTMRC